MLQISPITTNKQTELIKAYSINFGPNFMTIQSKGRIMISKKHLATAVSRNIHFTPEAVAFTAVAAVGARIAMRSGYPRTARALGAVGVVGAGYCIARPPTTPAARQVIFKVGQQPWQTSGTGQNSNTIVETLYYLADQ